MVRVLVAEVVPISELLEYRSTDVAVEQRHKSRQWETQTGGPIRAICTIQARYK